MGPGKVKDSVTARVSPRRNEFMGSFPWEELGGRAYPYSPALPRWQSMRPRTILDLLRSTGGFLLSSGLVDVPGCWWQLIQMNVDGVGLSQPDLEVLTGLLGIHVANWEGGTVSIGHGDTMPAGGSSILVAGA